MDFTRINLTNVYRGLDNVVLVIRPKSSQACQSPNGSSKGITDRIEEGSDAENCSLNSPLGKGLLIASHYDSAVCSTGEICYAETCESEGSGAQAVFII